MPEVWALIGSIVLQLRSELISVSRVTTGVHRNHSWWKQRALLSWYYPPAFCWPWESWHCLLLDTTVKHLAPSLMGELPPAPSTPALRRDGPHPSPRVWESRSWMLGHRRVVSIPHLKGSRPSVPDWLAQLPPRPTSRAVGWSTLTSTLL